MSNERRLGLGLDALLGGPAFTTPVEKPARPEGPPPQEVDLASVETNPFQPRTDFDDEETRGLADSIRRSGVLQPVLVRRVNGHFQLVAGERRLRAAKIAGLQRIPAVIREIDDRRMLELALVENLQRRDLNPMEKARAFQRLLQVSGGTQEDVAKAVGLSRPTVANFLRLLDLAPEIQECVSRGTISMGHARALLGTPNVALQKKLLKRILEEELSVREIERLVSGSAPAATTLPLRATKDAYTLDLERRLADFFGTKVTLDRSKKGGSLLVEWYSDDQFGGILKRLGI